MRDDEILNREIIEKVDRMARKLAKRCYPGLDADEVIAAGRLGLVDAARLYSEQGRPFWAYARQRIIGEIKNLAECNRAKTEPLEECHLCVVDLSAERHTTIRAVLAQLPEQGRRVLIGYYYHDQSQSEIARTLGISESRVSQVRLAALADVRRRLRLSVAG